MQDLRQIIWLASYPKSGNTWLRAFLANYFFETDGPASFEHYQRISSGDTSADGYREIAGVDPARLNNVQYMAVRRRYLEQIAGEGKARFVKTHCANIKLERAPLIPPDLTQRAIYLVRHPMDMLVSYADHWGVPLEEAAEQIQNPANAVPPGLRTAMQYLGAWADHVKGWTTTRAFPVLVLRYEDMLEDADAAFRKVLKHIQAPLDESVLADAIRRTSFDALAEQEQASGFPERGPNQEKFFRKGKAGQWRSLVPPDLVEAFSKANRKPMEKFKYLE